MRGSSDSGLLCEHACILLSEIGGHIQAQANLGYMYSHSQGVGQDFKAAAMWYTKAAEQGHAIAQNNLAGFYWSGKGVSKNNISALKWHTKAAIQGVASSQYSLGWSYEHGRGVVKNYKTALSWHTKAAKQGHSNSQLSLGMMYYDGRGVEVDDLKARMWWNLGVINGDEVEARVLEIVLINMSTEGVLIAQEMSTRCLNSGYTDC